MKATRRRVLSSKRLRLQTGIRYLPRPGTAPISGNLEDVRLVYANVGCAAAFPRPQLHRCSDCISPHSVEGV